MIGGYRTLFNRFIHWGRLGIFDRILEALPGKTGQRDRLMIDAASLVKRGSFRLYRRNERRPQFEDARRQRSRGTALAFPHPGSGQRLLRCPAPALSPAQSQQVLADRGYDTDWSAMDCKKGISPFIPPRRTRRNAADCDKILYGQGNPIESMVSRIKDWRRIATRCNRCIYMRNVLNLYEVG
jgi:transposase